MRKLTSILAVVDPTDEPQQAVVKASVLARHFGARLELFLCDSERAYALRHAYDRTGVAAAEQDALVSGRRYLELIRRSVAEDVPVTTHVACMSPLCEAISRHAREVQADLVIKCASGRRPSQRLTLDANDWQLARSCPSPLMLTQGRAWHPDVRFAAAVDVGDPNGASLARSIMETAGFLTLGCEGRLDVVYSDSNPFDEKGAAERRRHLSRLVNEFRVGLEHQIVLEGDADDTLPIFAARQGYDMMILGALARRRGPAGIVGTLTSRLIDSLDCDFLLVKADSIAAEDEMAQPAREVLLALGTA